MTPCQKNKKTKGEVVNALDHPNSEILDEGVGSSYMEFPHADEPDFSTPENTIRSAKETSFLEAMGRVDLWEEIRKYLTKREFQIFELKYRYQYKATDITKIVNVANSTVSVFLSTALAKLRKAFGVEEN